MMETIANRKNPQGPDQGQTVVAPPTVKLDSKMEEKIAQMAGSRLKGKFEPAK